MYTPSPTCAFATQSGANFRLKSFDTSTLIPLLSFFRGRTFTFHPNLAVFKKLLLPNRHGAFEFAYGPFAGFESRATVWRADGDDHAGLPNLETSGAMHDSHVHDLE